MQVTGASSATVEKIEPLGPAERTGIRVGDEILNLGSQPIYWLGVFLRVR